MIPFTLAAPFGSIMSAALAKAAKVPPLYLVIFAAISQVLGLSLISTLPNTHQVLPVQYGYEVIAGFGCAINISFLIVMTPFRVQERDKGKFISYASISFPVYADLHLAVALGSVGQFRVMGGAIALAIITTAFNSLVRGQLKSLLSVSELDALLKTPAIVETFPLDLQDTIR